MRQTVGVADAFPIVIIGVSLVAIVVAVVGIGRLWGERRLWLLVLSGLGLSVGIRLLFVNGFGILLPRGLIGDWLF